VVNCIVDGMINSARYRYFGNSFFSLK
jgi:hypothetical protein